MKKYILFASVLSLALGLNAQKLEKYEDALPKILSSPSSGIAASMQRYIQDDPENSSIYFQLGVVYYDRYLSSDILTDYQYKFGNAKKTFTNMTLAQGLVDEKVIKKNQDYFLNFGKYDSKGKLTVSWDTIQSAMVISISEVEKFIAGAPGVYESFTQSFTHYDKAHKQYTDLIGKYPTINDLYLLYNDEMDKAFETIKTEYEASIEAFGKYKAATDTFPIGYNQQMIIKDLDVYRLDGLSSEINFLISEIPIWNYAKWVDETRAYIHENIDGLRSDLNSEELRINKVLASAQSDYIKESFVPLDISKEVLFTLRKFDLQSVIEPLFLYKESKHDLLHRQFQLGDLENAVDTDPARKLYLYGEMINKIKKSDTLLLTIRTRNTRQTHEKYPDFLQTHYGGREGINSFARAESDQLSNLQLQYVNGVIDGVYNQLLDSSNIVSATYRKTILPLNPQKIPSLESLGSDAITTHRLKNFDGSAFIGGMKKHADGYSIAYVAGITKDGKVGWYNEYSLTLDSGRVTANTHLTAMKAVPGGCSFVLHVNQQDYPQSQNQLMILDESGTVQLERQLEITSFPRSITYNDRNNSLLLTFFGRDQASDVFETGQLTLARYSILGDLIWQQSINGRLSTVDAVTTIDGYVAVGNFSQFRAPDGRMLRAGGNATDVGVFVMTITNNGEITRAYNLESNGPSFATNVYKVSEECINILGSTGTYDQSAGLDFSGTSTYFMINRDLTELARKPGI